MKTKSENPYGRPRARCGNKLRTTHCWHHTGKEVQAEYLKAGWVHTRCCWCGATGGRPYENVVEQVPGHGPLETRTVRRYGDIEYAKE